MADPNAAGTASQHPTPTPHSAPRYPNYGNPEPLSDGDVDAIEARANAPHDALACGKVCWHLAHVDLPRLLADRRRLTAELARAEDYKAKWRRQAETATGMVEDLRQATTTLNNLTDMQLKDVNTLEAQVAEFTRHLADDDLPDDVDALRRYVRYARSTARYVDAGNKDLGSLLVKVRAQRDQARAELAAANAELDRLGGDVMRAKAELRQARQELALCAQARRDLLDYADGLAGGPDRRSLIADGIRQFLVRPIITDLAPAQPTPETEGPRADRYMMATRAMHALGNISRDEPDLAIIHGETTDDYIGAWVAGVGYTNVRFPKSSTRELTAAERALYRTKAIEIAGHVQPIRIDEPAESTALAIGDTQDDPETQDTGPDDDAEVTAS